MLGHGYGVGRWGMKYQTKSLTFLISFDHQHNIYTIIIITVIHNTVVHHQALLLELKIITGLPELLCYCYMIEHTFNI